MKHNSLVFPRSSILDPYPMTRLPLFALAVLFALAPFANGADLSKIERTIAKAPKISTDNPRYCLLAFGPAAKARVWLVVDGRKLYLDRNADGDLTQAGETLEAIRDPDTKQEPDEQGYREFRGEVQIPGDLDAAGKQVSHHVEVWMLNEAGSYLTVKIGDREHVSYPQFASKPADAPLLHVGGPLEILLADSRLARGKKSTDLRVQVATPGMGKDTAAALSNEKLDPAIRPELEVEFPAPPGGIPLKMKLALTERCCGSLFHGHVPVPEGAGEGKARLTVSFPAWKDGPPARTFELPLEERRGK